MRGEGEAEKLPLPWVLPDTRPLVFPPWVGGLGFAPALVSAAVPGMGLAISDGLGRVCSAPEHRDLEMSEHRH